LPARGGQSFPAAARLKSSREYSRLWRDGERCHTRNLTIIAAKPPVPHPAGSRLGTTVSRKVGNAVCRNRLKRWLREYFRSHKARLTGIADISVIAKPGAAHLTHAAFDQELQEALRRLRLYVDA